MFKRWTALGVVLVLLVAVLAACQPAPPAPTPAAPAAPPVVKPEVKVAKPAVKPEAPKHPLADKYGPKDVAMPSFMTYSGTSGPTSSYTFFSKAVLSNIEKAFPGINIRHLPGGTKPNLVRTQKGEAQFGITTVGETGAAWLPLEGEYKERQDNVRLFWVMPQDYQYILLTLADSPLKSVAELQGKRVATFYKGSTGTRFIFPAALEVYGLSYESIEKAGGYVYYAPNEQAQYDALAAGRVEVVFTFANFPSAPLKAFELTRAIKFIPWTEKEMKAMVAVPGTASGVIPKGTYKYQEADLPTPMPVICIVGRADLPEDVVYNLAWAFFRDDGKAYNEAHPAFARYNLLKAQEDPGGHYMPLHPGAAKYFKERGIKIPEKLQPFPPDWKKAG